MEWWSSGALGEPGLWRVGVTEYWSVAISTPTYGKTHVESGRGQTGVAERWSDGVLEEWGKGWGTVAPPTLRGRLEEAGSRMENEVNGVNI